MNGKNQTINTKATLGQGNNTITGNAYVKEKKLTFRTGDNGDYVNGKIILKVGDTEVAFNVMANRLNKNGDATKTYKAFQTVDKEYVTLDDVNGDVTKADIVGFIGKMAMGRPYVPEGKTQAVSYANPTLNWISRADKSKIDLDKDLGFKWDCDAFVESIVAETRTVDGVEGVETGRLKLNIVIGDYNQKVVKDTVIVPKEGRTFFEAMPANATVHLHTVKFINRIEKSVSTPDSSVGGWGCEEETHTFENVYREKIILGCKNPVEFDEYQDDATPQMAYNPALIRKGLADLKQELINAEAQANGGFTANKGFDTYDASMDDGSLPF